MLKYAKNILAFTPLNKESDEFGAFVDVVDVGVVPHFRGMSLFRRFAQSLVDADDDDVETVIPGRRALLLQTARQRRRLRLQDRDHRRFQRALHQTQTLVLAQV